MAVEQDVADPASARRGSTRHHGPTRNAARELGVAWRRSSPDRRPCRGIRCWRPIVRLPTSRPAAGDHDHGAAGGARNPLHVHSPRSASVHERDPLRRRSVGWFHRIQPLGGAGSGLRPMTPGWRHGIRGSHRAEWDACQSMRLALTRALRRTSDGAPRTERAARPGSLRRSPEAARMGGHRKPQLRVHDRVAGVTPGVCGIRRSERAI